MPEWNTQFFSLDNILFPFGHFELLTNTSLSVYNEIKISIEKSIIHEMVDLKMIEIRPNRIKPKVIILRKYWKMISHRKQKFLLNSISLVYRSSIIEIQIMFFTYFC